MEALGDARLLTSATFWCVALNCVGFWNLIQWLEDNPHLQSLKLCSRSLSDCNARDLEKAGRLVVALKEL
jgi:type II secretory pathway component PulM